MVDQLRSFAAEVTRVAREVGTEGKLGGQAAVPGVSGTWKDLTDSVNSMAGNLTSQVRNIAAVTTAVARGDLTKKITVNVQGEILELKNTINTMVDQLSSFAAEVTRVAREVGSEGKLGGQASVPGVDGTWKDLTDSVNFMAGNLTSQVRNIAEVTTAVARGDLTKKITVDAHAEILELKNTVNTMVDQLSSFAAEVTRVAREVGTEGKLGGQASVPGVAGTWKDLTDNVNLMAGNLTVQLRDVSKVATAIADGDLTQKVSVDVRGEILQIKNVINTMVDQLRSFASEVTRVAREVGTEGKLGGQAAVPGVSGTWKDLTDNVNFMAGNLTSQVRGIARVVTAVANGDLTRKLTVEAEGEIAALSDTINGMIDTLATFADQVTTVAREVGVEGKLGGQASVPGAAGTWKDLTDNVNRLAANLTTQVRAIAEVATAVTKGDLTRSIQVEAQAEVAALKDNINEMIRNLKDTTLKNAEQDWLKTNLAKFSRMLQGQRDLLTVGRMVLSELAPVVSAQQGVLYVLDGADEAPALRLLASYAHREHAALGGRLHLGDGLIGQCAVDRRKIELRSVPPDYLKIASGLGEAPPLNLVVLPILFEGQVKGVLELASFERFNTMHHAFLDQLTESIGIVLHTIEANTRTEDLLKQSQSLARELQLQQQELQGTNQQLEEKAKLLAEQNVEVERKNTEVEQARQALEEKAKQLALTSKFKSEFLANMSHELRTPLNSLLILSDQLSRNPSGNLTAKQVQFAQTIHASGNDLLTLINDILDLSKIESGTVVVEMEDYPLDHLRTYVDRTFRHVAEAQRLEFSIDIESRLPRSFETDPKRLQQVLKNLLSNAFKFTERGSVSLRVHSARDGWSREPDALNRTRSVLAIAVSDTGIGIPTEKQQIIFEAFQQADGSTSRKYGGTGLGLAISRELTRLLGGELVLQSSPDRGSTFTLFLPQTQGRPRARALLPDTIDVPAAAATPFVAVATPEIVPVADDDRDSIQQGDRVLLVVDNDLGFASVLLDFGRERGYKALTTAFGAAAIALARQRQPDAITLDICLPDIDGWHVLDRLKHDLATRHIPVFVITTEEDTERAYALGAVGVLTKPVHTKDALSVVFDTLADRSARPRVNLVIIGPDDVARDTLKVTLEDPQLVVHTPRTWDEAKTLLTRERVDCLALDGATCEKALADLSELSTHPNPPIAVFAPEGISKKTERQLRRLAARQAVRVAQSPERLIDDAALLLHRPFETLPEPGRVALERLYRGDAVLAGRTVLIVDDDIRNIFAMTTVLEGCQMTVISAEGGKEGIEKLQQTPGVDIVLMDIMMPDMDGYDTMRAIRRIPAFKSLPIVAVTAKAMKGDREKCIEAGAWDYLPKPVDSEQLLSVFRTWLHR
jgi:signal transduction histidine kinase/HAMP domain-containing protein/DNA-binding response OmpR family regulator